MKRRLDVEPESWRELRPWGGLEATPHYFESEALLALEAALETRRPLLIRGEPGTGKSQLARAAAHVLDAVLLVKVVDARTEIEDLFWRFDAVRRLADAQILGGLGVEREEAKKELAEESYLVPEALWWAFSWSSAEDQARVAGTKPPPRPEGWVPEKGARVLLLDEIDKADESVPNGLLAALGSGSFGVRGREDVCWSLENPPLVIITTNEERPLPDAFLRRCLVLHLALPTDSDELVAWLVQRGEKHVRDAEPAVLEHAAKLLVEDRAGVRSAGRNPPGQAEYLDLVHAAVGLDSGEAKRIALLDDLRDFAFWKHEPRGRGGALGGR